MTTELFPTSEFNLYPRQYILGPSSEFLSLFFFSEYSTARFSVQQAHTGYIYFFLGEHFISSSFFSMQKNGFHFKMVRSESASLCNCREILFCNPKQRAHRLNILGFKSALLETAVEFSSCSVILIIFPE